jgi:large subunit ribosomal protein L31
VKTGIHPEYVETTVECSCGNKFVTRSTKASMHVELCNECHPFYTGKQKLVDSGGRVERFRKRAEKADTAAVEAKRQRQAEKTASRVAAAPAKTSSATASSAEEPTPRRRKKGEPDRAATDLEALLAAGAKEEEEA